MASSTEEMEVEVDHPKDSAEVDLMEKSLSEEQKRQMEMKMKELEVSLEEKDLQLKQLKAQLKVAKEKLESFGYKGDLEEEAMKSLEQNERPSLFLETLPKIRNVSHIILEYLVAGEGGAQAILNLRRVNSTMKEWVDTLSPTISERIFKWIPIKFNMSLEDLRKFNKCPPPPPATALIFSVDNEWKTLLESDERDSNLAKAKRLFPAFFTFWTTRMKTLRPHPEENGDLYSSIGLDYPNALRNLDCWTVSSPEPHPILAQVETLIIDDQTKKTPKEELAFYEKLAMNRSLKRLRVKVKRFYDGLVDRIRNVPPDHNLLEGIQLLIDMRKNDSQLELFVALECYLVDQVTKEQLRSFIKSVAESSSKIRLIGWYPSVIHETRSLFLDSCEASDIQVGVDFMKCLHIGYLTEAGYAKDKEEEIGDLLKRQLFPNLIGTYMNCHNEEDMKNICNLPSSVKRLRVSYAMPFPLEMRDSLKMLSFLELYVYDSDFEIRSWTPGELVATLESICRNCPLLNTLRIFNFGGISKWKKQSEEYAPREPFKNLKSFSFTSLFVEEEDDEVVDTSATTNLLLNILQVQRMSLLKFTLSDDSEQDQMQLDSECVDALLDSALGKSLVSTNLDKYIALMETRRKFRFAVNRNMRLREEKFGRQGRREEFFDFAQLYCF